MLTKRILLVEDDVSNREVLRRILEIEGFTVSAVSSAKEALHFLSYKHHDLVISDLRMPGLSGLELLETIRAKALSVPFILLTAHGSIDEAVTAMKLDAVDFLTKPVSRTQIIATVHRALKNSFIANNKNNPTHRFIGVCPEIQDLRRTIRMIAPTKASVTITGESGTGKEVVAREIHAESGRAGKMVAVNCAAIPRELLESELFGHEKGAFTGADRLKVGLVELAANGTLLLDEIGELALELQPKLLRFLQNGEFYRVGGNERQLIDVRVIAATNANLLEQVEQKLFREDLWYRLNVVQLNMPALRSRGEDKILLAQTILEDLLTSYPESIVVGFSDAALSAINLYAWPGNIRELTNKIERAVVLSAKERIEPEHLGIDASSSEIKSLNHKLYAEENLELSFRVGSPLAEVERAMILKTLEVFNGDKTQAARALGINLRTIYRKLDSFNK